MNTFPSLRRVAAGLVAAGVLVAGSAWAHLITSVTAPGAFTFAGTVVLAGMTTPGFAMAAGERFVVTFSADCAVNAPAGDVTSYTDVDIALMGPAPLILQPTNALGGRFCSANGTAGFDGHARHSITVTGVAAAAGVYTVQVRGRTNGAPGAQAWYGDRALVVTR